jgi:hypothetical protein
LALVCATSAVPAAAQGDAVGEPAEEREPRVRIGFEGRAHFRDSEELALPSPFPFPPDFLPPGEDTGFMSTVNPGSHLEISVLSLLVDATWSPALEAHAKLDFIRLHDRNPTSDGREISVDELWLRFGREAPTAVAGERLGAYAKVGKFGKFERQDDRHLESYGLLGTAFNFLEDVGVELGVDLRNVYLKASLTQGNPLFFRDPNALAGDNGVDELREPNPVRNLGTGFPILYDAAVEDLDVDGDLELGLGLGFRLGGEVARSRADVLLWSYSRELADTVDIDGTFYGGDLDLLLGPGNQFPLPVSGNDKEEVGANVWIYSGPFSFFGQYADQEVAGLDRTGYEAELAWSFKLPRWKAGGGRQLLPYIQPAVRFSHLEPEFSGGSPLYPAPSVRWEWDKWDVGMRLGIVPGVDLTAEWADNTFVVRDRDESMSELLLTLRWFR